MAPRLVLTGAVGKKRHPLRGFLLTIVTFGIYRYYWIYKAPTEVYRQFELDREGRDDSVVWLILGILLPVLILVYDWKAVENVRYVRARLGLQGGITPAKFTLLPVAIAAVGFVVIVVGGLALETSGIGSSTDAAEGEDVLYGVAGLIFLVALAVNVWTYVAFQNDINAVWDAWAARVQQIATPAAAGPAATGASPAAAATAAIPPVAPAAPAGERYTCPSCARTFRLATLPAPGTLCPTCRGGSPPARPGPSP